MKIGLARSKEVRVAEPSTWMDAEVTEPIPAIVVPRSVRTPPLHHVGLLPIGGLAAVAKATMAGIEYVNLRILDEHEEQAQLLQAPSALHELYVDTVMIFVPSKKLPPGISALARR
jgi:hypothetical protein